MYGNDVVDPTEALNAVRDPRVRRGGRRGFVGRGPRRHVRLRRASSRPTSGSSRATGCPRPTARRWSGRSPSTRTPRSSACSRRATGSPGRPSCGARRSCMAKVQDEAGHGLYLYSAAETLGIGREEMLDLLHAGRQQLLLDLQLPDADLGRHRRHRLAGRRRRDHEPGAAVPVLLRPVRPGDDPDLQGGVVPPAAGVRDPLARSSRGTEAQRAMAQDAVDRWWWPSLMMFGPPDTGEVAPRSIPSSRWPGGSSGSPTTTCGSGSST